MSKPFTDVSFPTEHRAADVADHEVLMSFTNDDDALLFRDWWERWGRHLFGDYIDLSRRGTQDKVRASSIPSRQEMYAILKKRSEEIKEGRWYDDE